MSGIIGSTGSKSGVIGWTEIDYEEGEWTPSLNLSSVSWGIRYGRYTKIGDTVTIWCRMTVSSHSSSTSTTNHTLSGIPFNIDETAQFHFGIFNNNSGTVVGTGTISDSTTILFRAALPSAHNTFCNVTYKTLGLAI
jgi:hypothetical protein